MLADQSPEQVRHNKTTIDKDKIEYQNKIQYKCKNTISGQALDGSNMFL